MSLKDWVSSKSYRQATGEHFYNASPHLKETLIATAGVLGTGAVVYYEWFKHRQGVRFAKDSKHEQFQKMLFYQYDQDNQEFGTTVDNHFSTEVRLVLGFYAFTKHLVALPILLPAAANTGVQIFKVTYCEDKGFSAGFSESWKQACDAAYGAKEIALCAGNAAGYLGTLISVDGIYDNVVVPCMGDVLHIH
jgi:hypothetical protein